MRPRTGLLRLSLFALASTLAIPASEAADEIPSRKDIQMVSPALDTYTQNRLLGEVWKPPGLSLRDRSVVTVAALIGRNQTIALSEHLKLALDHGVKPAEISEIITHLAFYSGWANAMAAVVVTRDVFAERNIGPPRLPAASPALLPLNEAAEADRTSASAISSAQCFQVSCNTRSTFCSATCGCVRIWRRATAASSRLAP
jgi:4-carboxymuconolactone decarboxylase